MPFPSIITRINNLSVGEISDIAEKALGGAVVDGEVEWKTSVLPGESIGNGTLGLFKVEGSASVNGSISNWSAVVKAIDPDAEIGIAGPNQHGRIELAAFAAGQIQSVETGLRPVPTYGITENKDNTSWLWLKDLSGSPRPPWTPETYATIARGIGQFNGLWPEGVHPRGAWLDEIGVTDRRAVFPAQWRTANEELREQSNLPEFSKITGTHKPDRIFRLIDDLATLIEATKTYPRSVAHNDCHTGNLFFDPDGSNEIIYAIDWAQVGLTPIGVDAGSFIGTGMSRDRTQYEATLAHMDRSFDSYLLGLRDSGWDGNESEIKVASISSIATYVFMLALMAGWAITHDSMENITYRRMNTDRADALDQIAERFETFIPIIDEGLELAKQLE